MAKYDNIGTYYNQTRRADPYLLEQMLRKFQATENQRYLDIGCGTGNYTIALYEKGLTITGLDPSLKMLQTANAKNSNIKWTQGSAENIPFENYSFDAALASLTLHHWNSLKDGFRELSRVLKSGGQFTIFTSTKNRWKDIGSIIISLKCWPIPFNKCLHKMKSWRHCLLLVLKS